MEGASEGELHEPLARQAAELCREAGAGPEAIPGWIGEGRRRGMPPFSGGLHGGECRAAPVLREVHRERGGCASISSWKSPQDEIYPVQGT